MDLVIIAAVVDSSQRLDLVLFGGNTLDILILGVILGLLCIRQLCYLSLGLLAGYLGDVALCGFFLGCFFSSFLFGGFLFSLFCSLLLSF